MNKTTSIIIIVLVLGGVLWFGLTYKNVSAPDISSGGTNGSTTVRYACTAGKTITAVFTQGKTKLSTNPDQPPIPGGSATVTLSDGRTMTLAQTISADGVRYSNGNPQIQQGQPGSETFVFWSKGNGALVLENNQEKSYTGCVQVANDPGGLLQIYSNSEYGFSIRLPQGYTTDATYEYQASGPNKIIHGVRFTVPQGLTQGTNLSTDTYVSVEQIPQTQNCTADKFLYVNTEGGGGSAPQTLTDGGVTYSFLNSTDAAAGNRYEESVYAIPGTQPCTAVRYLIHYGVFENYPAGSIVQFDEAALKQQFDQIRRTLILNQ